MSLIYSATPVTITGQVDIEADAPRSQGMDDATAQAVIAANDELTAQVIHLHVDVAGMTAQIEVDNPGPDGSELWLDYGDGNTETLVAPDVTRDHNYLVDGLYTVAVYTRTGVPEMAQAQAAVNWPQYPLAMTPKEDR